MAVTKFSVPLLLMLVVTCAWSRGRHHEYYPQHREKSVQVDFGQVAPALERIAARSARHDDNGDAKGAASSDKESSTPFSAHRLEKMLEKAIMKIITGDLSTANVLLLKSLNYSFDEVQAIREQELGRPRKNEKPRDLADLVPGDRRSYNEELHGKRTKHRRPHDAAERDSYRNDPDVETTYRDEKRRDRYREKTAYDDDLDFEAYNRQSTIDYENLSDTERRKPWSDDSDYEDQPRSYETERETEQSLRRSFDRAMEPHVVFKIRYDDSEFDSSSGSDERSALAVRDALVPKGPTAHRATSTLRHTAVRNDAGSFHASSLPASSSPSSSSPLPPPTPPPSSSARSSTTERAPLPVAYQLVNFKAAEPDRPENRFPFDTTESNEPSSSSSSSTVTASPTIEAAATTTTDDGDADGEPERRTSEYEGLEWVEDDVYRVVPEFMDSMDYAIDENEASSDREQDPEPYQADGAEDVDDARNGNASSYSTGLAAANANASSAENAPLAVNLTAEQRIALDNRRQLSEKAIEDIKARVLAATGRVNPNFSANTNQVQRERLTMFSPTCQLPRNADLAAWENRSYMNMHFQLNLSATEHVVAAKLRLYKLPQENVTTSGDETFDDIDRNETRIRISVYHYTKALKKFRAKRRLLDSIMTPLTTEGAHLALDVKQGLRFWRTAPRNSHGNHGNHGLVVQVEDQEGKLLEPALYIQQPSCGDHDSDQKASHLAPGIFIRACARYVRIVNGQKVIYVNCRH